MQSKHLISSTLSDSQLSNFLMIFNFFLANQHSLPNLLYFVIQKKKKKKELLVHSLNKIELSLSQQKGHIGELLVPSIYYWYLFVALILVLIDI